MLNGQAEWLEEGTTGPALRGKRAVSSSSLILPGQFFDSPELSSDELLPNFLVH
jgi:hypothetical protein